MSETIPAPETTEKPLEVVGLDKGESTLATVQRLAEKLPMGKKMDKPLITPQRDKRYDIEMGMIWWEATGEVLQLIGVNPQMVESILVPGTKLHKVIFTWTKPTWAEQQQYRQDAQRWQGEASVSVTNRLELHKIYITKHLKAVKGLLDEKGTEIELTFLEDGDLSPKSYDAIVSCDLAILDTALWRYEREVLRTQV